MTVVWIDYVPLWLLFLMTVALVLLSIEAGRYVAAHRLRQSSKPADPPIGAVIGSTFGMLAFLLAFTFGIAASRFDVRRQLLLDEVNAISTCYLRAGMIPETERVETRRLLREYVHNRAELGKVQEKLPELLPSILRSADEQLDALWLQAERVAQIDRNSEMYSLFVGSMNDVIDLHTKRLVVGLYRIPGSIWLALYVVSILSMAAVGYHFGLYGSRDLFVSLFLGFSFAVVIVLIADVDNPTAGNLRINQQPMIDLDRKLQSAQ